MITTHDLTRFIPQTVNTIHNFTIGKTKGKNSVTTTQMPVKKAPQKVKKTKK